MNSIGLGEDGPTHQPVEHLAALRAMPNLNVFRPADAVECAECLGDRAASRRDAFGPGADAPGPAAAFGPHGPARISPAKGAYVLVEPEGARDVTLIATGSEVALAVECRGKDARRGGDRGGGRVDALLGAVRHAQDEAYQRRGSRQRSARRRRGRGRVWLGGNGSDRTAIFVGMHGFGASAPAEDLYKHFGITAGGRRGRRAWSWQIRQEVRRNVE